MFEARWFMSVCMLSGLVGMLPIMAAGADSSPATGYDIHVQAPHMMPDGTPGGPYHHYCKGISDQILQCLLFESTDSKAPLVAGAMIKVMPDYISAVAERDRTVTF